MLFRLKPIRNEQGCGFPIGIRSDPRSDHAVKVGNISLIQSFCLISKPKMSLLPQIEVRVNWNEIPMVCREEVGKSVRFSDREEDNRGAEECESSQHWRGERRFVQERRGELLNERGTLTVLQCRRSMSESS